MTTVLTPALANAAARGLNHAPGPWKDFGVMRYASCSKCGAGMVERVDDGKGVTGAMLERACKGKA